MKKFWKALGITALAASVIPYYVDSDESKCTKTIRALLWQVKTHPSEEHEGKTAAEISLGLNLPDFKKLAASCKGGCEQEEEAEVSEEAAEAAEEEPAEAPQTAKDAPADSE